MAGSKMK